MVGEVDIRCECVVEGGCGVWECGWEVGEKIFSSDYVFLSFSSPPLRVFAVQYGIYSIPTSENYAGDERRRM